MTPEAQRIALAELCGWEQIYPAPGGPRGFQRVDGNLWDDETEMLPDYLNDLNAMHEAEKVLTKKQQQEYGHWLWSLNPTYFAFVTVTAAQRCEALLKTFGKWTI